MRTVLSFFGAFFWAFLTVIVFAAFGAGTALALGAGAGMFFLSMLSDQRKYEAQQRKLAEQERRRKVEDAVAIHTALQEFEPPRAER